MRKINSLLQGFNRRNELGIKTYILRHVITVCVAVLVAGAPGIGNCLTAAPQKKTERRQSASTTKKNSSRQKAKKSAATASKKKRSKGSGKKRSTAEPAQSSSELKRQEESTRKEIRLTKEQIAENDRNVKKSLSELGRIEADINTSRTEMGVIDRQVKTLGGKIGSLENSIAKGNTELARLRAEYLKAVKKMRATKGNRSTLAFIFGSKSFNEGLRRMRYLRQFSKWKDRRSAEINSQIALLDKQRRQLNQARADKNEALRRQGVVQARLEKQKSDQDVIVAELRRNGDALRSHLAAKQAEADRLRSEVSRLIAREQQKAAEERARREAAERKARQEAEAAEARRLAAEQEAARKAEAAAAQPKSEAKAQTKETKKSEGKKVAGQEQAKASDGARKGSTQGKDYAQARKRRPRSDQKKSDSKKSTPTPKKMEGGKSAEARQGSGNTGGSGGDFASHRGSLPRPVSGSFRVTSQFGRHSLPDMPDVQYDNPGIDAEVAKGATAQAVYAGTVAGVYIVPGFANVVIVRHGDYYTVYGNIASPAVAPGDKVKQGQSIGKVGADPDDASRGSLHFEVWKNREKQNPMAWIR